MAEETKEEAFEKACPESAKILRKQKKKQKTEPIFLSQFAKGDGSARREHNIQTVVQMLKDGITEKQVQLKLALLFKVSTVNEYINIAKEIITSKGKKE